MMLDNRLDYLDQTALELLRATGRRQLMQAIWVYEHPVDLEGLRDFHRRFGSGLIGRLVERSPLPFARARWVTAPDPPSLVVEPDARPRAQLMDWADDQSKLPIDPERGPGWNLGVLPMTDGATAVSIVFSHCLGDGGGLILSVHDAVSGNPRHYGYPLPRARSRAVAAAVDLLDTAREVPRAASALKSLAQVMISNARQRKGGRREADSPPAVHDPDLDRVVDIPSVVITADTEIWDARAEALGGTTYSLLAGFTAKLAEHLGRTRSSDGAVALVIAGNARSDFDDDRALAMTFANAVIDPGEVTKDLVPARDLVRKARDQVKNQTDSIAALRPLVPWAPQRAAKAVVGLMFSYADDVPSSCSNLGDLPGHLANADGTPAEHAFARSIDQNVTLRELERSRGTLVVVSGRINGRVWIAVEAFELHADNTRARLRDIVDQTLAEFGVSGATEW